MRGHLTKEIRLKISVTRLKNGTRKLREKVAELVRSNKEKDRRIAILEAKLTDKEAQRKELLSYLYKPTRKNGNSQPRGKKPGSQGYHRPKPNTEDVTERRTYSVTKCPACGTRVGEAVEETIKYEEDIVLVPRKTVKEFTITRHWCGKCGTFVRSADIPPISRIGPNTLAYILYARYRLRLPFGKIRESLSDLHNFNISEGEIAAKLQEAEALFGKDYDAITALIEQAKVVYADETGWRMEGERWWLWCFTTNEGTKYLLEDTRGTGVAAHALGEKKDRVLISDGYAAYRNLPGEKQQCWVHLLRVAKIHSPALYGDLALLYHKLLLELEKPVEERNKLFFEKELDVLVRKKYPEPMARKPQERLRRDARDLLTCLSYEQVLPENNTAERAIRPQVIMRKIFGGSRSVAGASAHAVNTSVLRTLEQQNPDKNFFGMLLPLIEKRRSEL